MPFYFEDIRKLVDEIQDTDSKEVAYKAIRSFQTKVNQYWKEKRINPDQFFTLRGLITDLEYSVYCQ